MAEESIRHLIRRRKWERCLQSLSTRRGRQELRNVEACIVGDVPLAAAIRRGAPLRVVRAILRAHPEAGAVTGRHNLRSSPLSMAIAVGAPKDVLLEVLAANPGATGFRSKALRGNLYEYPLHLAVRQRLSAPLLAEIGRHGDPGLALEPMAFSGIVRDLPLHFVCRCKDDAVAERIRELLSIEPNAVYKHNRDGHLPIHVACLTSQTKETISLFLEVDPSLAMTPSRGGDLPFHIAMRNLIDKRSTTEDAAQVVAVLFDTDPSVASVPIATRNGKKELPLHVAIKSYAAAQTPQKASAIAYLMFSLLSHFPEALKIPLERDHVNPPAMGPPEFCLHRLVKAPYANAPLVRKVLHYFPEAAQLHTFSEEWLALHILCHERASHSDLVRELLHVVPDAAQKADTNGNLPLHLACACPELSGSTVRLLLNACPLGVQRLNLVGLYPLQAACSNRFLCLDNGWRAPEVLSRLVAAFPEAARARTSFRFPADVLYEQGLNRVPDKNVMRPLLRAAPEALFAVRDSSRQSMIIDVLESHGEGVVEELLVAAYGEHELEEQFGEKNNVVSVHQPLPFPMHNACTYLAYLSPHGKQMLQVIHRLFPESVKSRNMNGDLPLHIVFQQATTTLSKNQWQQPQDARPARCDEPAFPIVQTLLSFGGEALYVADSNGNVPFVAASLGGATMNVLYHLLRENPSLAFLKTTTTTTTTTG